MADALAVHLLGRPSVLRAGRVQPTPRGRKAWALLAYLLTTETAPSRDWLAGLLFADADDPLNALSWNLTQLRRLLGDDVTLSGDPVLLRLPPGSFVDVHAVTSATWRRAIDVPGLGHDLLEGMGFPTCPGFEAWLLASRRRYAGAAESVLREAARARLAAGDGRGAVDLAARLVAANPFDEDAQEILIRGYAATGDLAAARTQRDACVEVFRRELGSDPGLAVHAAAEPRRGAPPPTTTAATPATTSARLEAGLSALDAGAVDTAVDLLRQAVTDAQETFDDALRVQALVALGRALVHGVRGHDGEGAAVLLEAIDLADRAGISELAGTAYRELGYVELLRGRYDRAQQWLDRALALVGEDPVERAWVLAVRGVAASDVGRYEEALATLDEARRLSSEGRLPQVEAWAHTFRGRTHLLRGELGPARVELERGLACARAARWTSFVPLPEVLLAEIDLVEGADRTAESAFEHAHAMALQLGDPCWEGLAARGLGKVAARRGDTDTALRWLSEARHRCVRLPDAHLWIEAYCLDALCELALARRRADAPAYIDDLETLAARTGMREFVARAYAHRGRLGSRDAAEAARVLAAEVT